MASADLLTQRSATARPRPAYAGLTQAPATPGSPHTPLLSRSFSSQFGSPGAHRIEDEHVIFEIGSRFFRAGFAGEPSPKFIWQFGPDSNKRAGDYNKWTPRSLNDNDHASIETIAECELWDYDVSNLDLGLVEDRLERALRTAHEKYMLLDVRTRSATVVLPPALPNPLVELVLKTIFTGNNHPKSVYLASNPVLCTISAGLRSALIVDIGWHETTVTAVYEYREIVQKRSIRAGKRLTFEIWGLLSKLSRDQELATDTDTREPVLSFSSVERLITGLLWCRNENEHDSQERTDKAQVGVPFGLDQSISIPFSDLAKPAECLLLSNIDARTGHDYHDLPLHIMMWKLLLTQPKDVRGTCMSRIVFTGGCSSIPGLKGRIIDELQKLIRTRGWDPVYFKSTDTAENEDVSKESLLNQNTQHAPSAMVAQDRDHDPSELDEISRKLEHASLRTQVPARTGKVGAVNSLGAWAGASLMGHLRVDSSVEIKREDFLKHGMNILGYPIH